MRRLFLTLMAIAAIALVGCKDNNDSQPPPDPRQQSDCMVVGNIITMDEENPTAQAVVAKNGIIQFVGDRKDAEQYCTDKTQILDYGTSSVYPGFIEGHVHGMEVATRQFQLDLSELDDDPQTKMWDFLAAIRAYVKANDGFELYKGAGWTVHFGVQPTRQMLDSICDTKPMIFTSVDGHSF